MSRWAVWILVLLLVSMIVTNVDASPHKAALERGKEIGRVVTAKELYRAYQEIQSEYHEKAFGATNSKDWKVLNRGDGVEIAMMQHKSDPTCPYVRMTAVMPTPVLDCWDFLSLSNWDRTMPKMDPFYEGLSVFGEYRVGPVHMLLARKRTKRVFAFGKRDFCFVSVSDVPRKDGTWVSGTVSVITPQIPRRKGYTRAYQDSIAFYKPIENGQKTRLTIVFRIDMNDSSQDGEGGFMPMWIYVKSIGKIGAQSVKSMRSCLAEEMKEKAADQGAEKTRSPARFPFRPKPMTTDEKGKGGKFERESLVDIEAEGDEKPKKQNRYSMPWGREKRTETKEPQQEPRNTFFPKRRPDTQELQPQTQPKHNPFFPRRTLDQREPQEKPPQQPVFSWRRPWTSIKVGNDVEKDSSEPQQNDRHPWPLLWRGKSSR